MKTKLTLITVLLGAGLSAHAAIVNEAGKAPYFTNYEEGLAHAKANSQPLVLKFFSPN